MLQIKSCEHYSSTISKQSLILGIRSKVPRSFFFGWWCVHCGQTLIIFICAVSLMASKLMSGALHDTGRYVAGGRYHTDWCLIFSRITPMNYSYVTNWDANSTQEVCRLIVQSNQILPRSKLIDAFFKSGIIYHPELGSLGVLYNLSLCVVPKGVNNDPIQVQLVI